MFAIRLYLVVVVVVVVASNLVGPSLAEDKLRMVHVIFRHGHRYPSVHDRYVYTKDPHRNSTAYPDIWGGLTNQGKLWMYQLGQDLRDRYDGFLGNAYNPELARIRVTDKPRSVMSAQLVSAGLWPPTTTQRWNPDLLWQPIHLEPHREKIDNVMFPYKCPNYQRHEEQILGTSSARKSIELHRKFLEYIGDKAGLRDRTIGSAFFLYQTLSSQLYLNQTMPSWTEGYFPSGELYDVALLWYQLANWDSFMKRINGGQLLREIIGSYVAYAGKDPQTLGRKLTLYSGHENNVCALLYCMNLRTRHVPDYGSAVIFELHENTITRQFGIQTFYRDGSSREISALVLEGCEKTCPVRKFTSLLSEVIPEDDEDVCGLYEGDLSRNYSSSSTITSKSISLLFTLHFTLLKFIIE